MLHTAILVCCTHVSRPLLPSDDLQLTRDWIQGCHERGTSTTLYSIPQLQLTPPSDNNWNFAVVLDSSPNTHPQVIGLMGAVRAPEIGYMFNSEHWGKGYATEALRAFMPLFFAHYNGEEAEKFEYAVALTDTELVSSQHVLLKAGFRLHERRDKDFENPVLGTRDTLVFRMYRDGLAPVGSGSE